MDGQIPSRGLHTFTMKRYIVDRERLNGQFEDNVSINRCSLFVPWPCTVETDANVIFSFIFSRFWWTEKCKPVRKKEMVRPRRARDRGKNKKCSRPLKKTLIEARKHGDFSFDEEWEGTRRRGRGIDRKREREREQRRGGNGAMFQLPNSDQLGRKKTAALSLLSVRLVCSLNLHDDRNVIERDVLSQPWAEVPRDPLFFSPYVSSHRVSRVLGFTPDRTFNISTSSSFKPSPFSFSLFFPFHRLPTMYDIYVENTG